MSTKKGKKSGKKTADLPSRALGIKDAKGVKGGGAAKVNTGAGMSKGFYNWISDSDHPKRG